MKGFKDLIFEVHPNFPNSKQARIDFENRYGVSVIIGKGLYSNGINTYELAIIYDNKICYDTPITNDVMGYLTEDEISNIMKQVQYL